MVQLLRYHLVELVLLLLVTSMAAPIPVAMDLLSSVRTTHLDLSLEPQEEGGGDEQSDKRQTAPTPGRLVRAASGKEAYLRSLTTRMMYTGSEARAGWGTTGP
ncbi:uncharacterized protein MKK02DRAFT_28764 [Dioszegia hungarica]|uniref:Uncharacterized protein n=1 Tax=Dioszegia hungarica TaxID=4972 RepID=A0AA38LUM6_9TREE|nr:uncharacterized protein MKK02DRAFT_28764 [Dioszegia hungarica]KAI9634051.1 hypothetical protein MKK02DRAFT_28764 [Dioszegia hungarica]